MNKIAFIGAGNMNASIIKGLVGKSSDTGGIDAKNIIVSNPSPEKREALAVNYGIQQTQNNIEAASFADVIVLGVKPYLIAQVCQQISEACDITNKCFISVAAGTTIEQIQHALGSNAAVVRTMPNTPSELGLGMTGLFASSSCTEQDKTLADKIMTCAGETVWLDEEEKINDLTSISGSGPAYFFLFMEAMEKQALALGFDQATSRKLVQQTALGAAHMVVENPTLDISKLRENVTSKGGVTHAAITTFIEGELPQLVTTALNAALHRAQEIAQNSDS